MKRLIPSFLSAIVLFVIASAVCSDSAHADTFGSGDNTFEIEFASIPSVGEYEVVTREGTFIFPGNRPDNPSLRTFIGAVPYDYRIGKFEISEQMIEKANALGGLGITKDTRGPNKPATSVSWFEAAQFVNWLNTSTGGTPAYKFDDQGVFQLWEPTDAGYNPNNLFRNTEAKYVLPSSDEWYKAAYYDAEKSDWNYYPTIGGVTPTSVMSGTDPGTAVFRQGLSTGPADIMQAGGLSPYGTMAQGGNVSEWEETESDFMNDAPFSRRGRRGGNWNSLSSLSSNDRFDGLPANGRSGDGFRVISVPEPRTLGLLCISLTLNSVHRRRSRNL